MAPEGVEVGVSFKDGCELDGFRRRVWVGWLSKVCVGWMAFKGGCELDGFQRWV